MVTHGRPPGWRWYAGRLIGRATEGGAMVGVRHIARVVLAAVCAFVVVGVAAGCGAGGSGDTASYKGADGYRLAYPKDWRAGPRKLMATSRFEVMVLPKGTTIPDVALDVFVQPTMSGVEGDVSDFLATSENNGAVSGYHLVSKKKRMVSGNHDAYVVVQTYKTRGDGGAQVALRQTDLLTDTPKGQSLDVRLTCRQERAGTYGKSIDAVVDSVRIPG